jgi:hypothetical protein
MAMVSITGHIFVAIWHTTWQAMGLANTDIGTGCARLRIEIHPFKDYAGSRGWLHLQALSERLLLLPLNWLLLLLLLRLLKLRLLGLLLSLRQGGKASA